MAKPRGSSVNLNDTAYYHCISRCVRQSFLCGIDSYTGKNYEHRRQWVEDRIHLLASVFAIDVCAYAVMHNHTHTVLHINREKAQSWTSQEVLERWHELYKPKPLSIRYLNPQTRSSLSDSELTSLSKEIEMYRERLCSLSWFMGNLNEKIARRANKEDNCSGRFWEGRFQTIALLDEAALLSCMSYVDLNPIRAQLANQLDTSTHTSIRYRLKNSLLTEANQDAGVNVSGLAPFLDQLPYPPSGIIPFNFSDYTALLEDSTRILAERNTDITTRSHNTLTSFSILPTQWRTTINKLESYFFRVIGRPNKLKEFVHRREENKTVWGMEAAKRLFIST